MNCIFCKIIKGELPAKLVYKDNDLWVFHDIAPKAPVHVLMVSIKHIESLDGITDVDRELMSKIIFKIPQIAKKLDISKGYKIIANNGRISGQIVFHLHFHILGGWGKSPGWAI